MIFALPTQTIQAFLAIHKLGWRPRIFVNSVSIDPFVMEVVQRNTSKRLVEGAISSAFLKDPTDPALARDAGVKLYKQILRRYLPGREGEGGRAPVRDGGRVHDGRRAAEAGAQPTRASLLRAATHLNERANPFFVKGIAVRTGPNDYYPVERTPDAALPRRPLAPVRRPRERPLSPEPLNVRTLTDGGQQPVEIAREVEAFLGAAERTSTSRSTTSTAPTRPRRSSAARSRTPRSGA